MVDSVKSLAILGSTGSIGTQTLDVVRAFPDRFNVHALAAGRNVSLLEKQIAEFKPSLVYCDGEAGQAASFAHDGCRPAGLIDMVCAPEVDLVVTATVGDVALAPTFAAIRPVRELP